MSRSTCLRLAGAALLFMALPAAGQQIQKPRDTWQQPGEIQVPKGIQAIRAQEERCTKRFQVVSVVLDLCDPAGA